VATFVQFMRRHMRNEKQRVFKIARSRLDSRDAQGLETSRGFYDRPKKSIDK
jgi:hypothetical protein